MDNVAAPGHWGAPVRSLHRSPWPRAVWSSSRWHLNIQTGVQGAPLASLGAGWVRSAPLASLGTGWDGGRSTNEM